MSTTMMIELNPEPIVTIVTTHIDLLICHVLGAVFNSVSLVLWALEYCRRPLQKLNVGGQPSSTTTSTRSATEYLMEATGGYDDDDDCNEEEVHPRWGHLSWPSSPSTRSLRRRRGSMGKEADSITEDDDHSTHSEQEPEFFHPRYAKTNRQSPLREDLKNELLKRSSSIADRIKLVKSNSFTERTKNNMRTKFSERSISIANSISMVKSNSFTDRTKIAIKEKLSEKSTVLKEKINLVKSNSFTDRTKNTIKAKISERRNSISERINIVKNNSFTEETKENIRTKLSERSASFKDRVKLERFGSSRTRI